MRLFGFEVTKAASTSVVAQTTPAFPVDNRGGWWGIVRESFAGAWQQNVEVRIDTVLTQPTIFRCQNLIASDISKMRCRLVEQDVDGLWTETEAAAFTPVLRKPNHYQNRIQFFESWLLSKLTWGNTYVLKQRDGRGAVTAMYILDPNRVTPLVAPDGSVFYQLKRDDLSKLPGADGVTVPASEIIHDRWNTLFHPLVGLSPIYACGLAAVQSLKIQTNSAKFFGNHSNPGGVLTAPGVIAQATADRLKTEWDTKYSGDNFGKVAILGDGLTYQPMVVNAVDSQLVEQLKWTAETICACYGVPGYKVGVGPAPSQTNIEALDQQYYSQCLQVLIECIELCLDEGLALPKPYGTEFDLDDLLRMDTRALVEALAVASKAGALKPDEFRRRIGYGKVPGGDTPYLQQQNYSLAALAKRDAGEDPFATAQPAAEPPAPANDDEAATQALAVLAAIRKGFA